MNFPNYEQIAVVFIMQPRCKTYFLLGLVCIHQISPANSYKRTSFGLFLGLLGSYLLGTCLLAKLLPFLA